MVQIEEYVILKHQDVFVIPLDIMEKIVNLNSLIVEIMILNVQEEVNVILILEHVLVKMDLKEKIAKKKLSIVNMIKSLAVVTKLEHV